MRIAVASDGLDVSLHGSRCASYTCYTVERGIITTCQNTPNPCLAPEFAAQYLKDLGVDVFLATDIDPEMRTALKHRGIETAKASSGSTKRAVEKYLSRLFNGEDPSTDESDLTLSAH